MAAFCTGKIKYVNEKSMRAFPTKKIGDPVPPLIEENTFIADGSPMYVAGYNFLGADFTSSKNTYWDLSGNEPIMIKKSFGDIHFGDWQSYYGYDQESKVEKPDEEILKKVTEN
jgi:hypothetical protein